MRINELFIDALRLNDEDICGINILCASDISSDVEKYAEEAFNTAWEKAISTFKDQFGECKANDKLVKIISKKDYGIQMLLNAPILTYQKDEEYETGLSVILEGLSSIKRKYSSNISFEGYLGFNYSNNSKASGGVIQKEITSEGVYAASDVPEKTYDFVKEFLNEHFNDSDYSDEIIGLLEGADEYDYIEMVQNLHSYGLDSFIDNVLEIAEETDEDIYDSVKSEVRSWNQNGDDDWDDEEDTWDDDDFEDE